MHDIGLEMKMKLWEFYKVKPHCVSAIIDPEHAMAAADQ